ncbi:hypothetical protein ACLQ20_24100 [Micromonospora sp. DT46]|uniref:hypothetical protein n=1 Tax=Micromonospora sp. DT46 TaxID=3393435 RepID=UPI003CF04CFC
MTYTDARHTVEFRRSALRLVRRTTLGLLAAAVIGVLVSLARGRLWWDGLWVLLPYLAVFHFSPLPTPPRGSQRTRLPVRLDDQRLEVSGPGDTTLAIDWSNVERAEIRGRLTPSLHVEPADPERTRPPMRRWQWAGYGQSRPYEIVVPLTGMTPGPGVLRRELARWLPGATQEDTLGLRQ